MNPIKKQPSKSSLLSLLMIFVIFVIVVEVILLGLEAFTWFFLSLIVFIIIFVRGCIMIKRAESYVAVNEAGVVNNGYKKKVDFLIGFFIPLILAGFWWLAQNIRMIRVLQREPTFTAILIILALSIVYAAFKARSKYLLLGVVVSILTIPLLLFGGCVIMFMNSGW